MDSGIAGDFRAALEEAVIRYGKDHAVAVAQRVLDDIKRNGISIEGGRSIARQPSANLA